MPGVIKIRRGLNIKLQGKAEKIIIKTKTPEFVAVKPVDFHGIQPKLAVSENDTVKGGSVLFTDKNNPEIKFTSPVSGSIKAINRGERRAILEIVISPDESNGKEEFVKADPASITSEEIISNLLNSGLWPVIRQRPYNIIANPTDTPKAIFISAFDTAPLAPDYEYILKDSGRDFQTGINALIKLTSGKVHLNVENDIRQLSVFHTIKGVQLNKFKGPHPAGNVGTQIHYIDPINKGEKVWFINPQDVVAIGRLFDTGHYDASHYYALAGSEVLNPRYFKSIKGACVYSIATGNVKEGDIRYISGNPLSGNQVSSRGFMGFYDSQLTLLPEGNRREFFGWLAPGFEKFSLSGSFPSWLAPDKEYRIDTNLHGGRRALMITGKFEKVFPFDILPMQLIKAAIIQDIDQMERLGIYEVVEEDFALCEFVDTSKTDIQAIIRKGLDLMYNEMK